MRDPSIKAEDEQPAEREAIRDGVRRLFADYSTEADARRAMASESGHDPELWAAMAAIGLPGLVIAPDHGGIGADLITLELVMEEAGAALICAPFLSSAILAATLLGEADDEATAARLLPGIADGSRIATVAVTGDRGCWTPAGVAVAAATEAGLTRLRGHAAFVTHAHIADTLLVIAHGAAGLAAYEVDPRGTGVTIVPDEGLDRTLRLSRIRFDDALGLPIAGADDAAIARTLALACVALAGEQVGGARRIFEMTIAYLKARVQFGRPVGGFQALKHIAADLLIEVESATSAARHAARMLAERSPEAASAVPLAAFACADAFARVAAEAIQLHGGIAFTWDHPAHLYLRRARAGAVLFGTSRHHRDRYLAALEHVA